MTDNDLKPELNLKMTGMWEGKADQNPEDAYYNCRYLIVWAELNSNEMAGVVCGYSGGGSHEKEDFYARHSFNGVYPINTWA